MSIDKEVVALLLGDGHVSSRGIISIKHCIAQKEYALYKAEILLKHGFKTRWREVEQLSYGKMRGFIVVEGYASSESKSLRELLYPQGHKIVPDAFVNSFDFKDWSFIFMDDGRTNAISHYNTVINGERVRKETEKFTNRYEICTESFDTVSNVLLVNNLLSLGVESKVDNRNRIVITRSLSKIAFYNGIKDFIVPSMMYKIKPLPSLSYNSQ